MLELGYFIKDKVISEIECDDLISKLSSIDGKKGKAGKRHLMNIPEIKRLANDNRLIEIAKVALDKIAIPYKATLFEKSGRANWLIMWHQDTALPLTAKNLYSDWGSWSEKDGIIYAHAPNWALERIIALRINLDASTIDNGPLQVIPSTHKYGVLKDEEVFEIAKNNKKEICLTSKGGIIGMKPLLIHSSAKVNLDSSRRVLHIEYTDSLELKSGIKLAMA